MVKVFGESFRGTFREEILKSMNILKTFNPPKHHPNHRFWPGLSEKSENRIGATFMENCFCGMWEFESLGDENAGGAGRQKAWPPTFRHHLTNLFRSRYSRKFLSRPTVTLCRKRFLNQLAITINPEFFVPWSGRRRRWWRVYSKRAGKRQ